MASSVVFRNLWLVSKKFNKELCYPKNLKTQVKVIIVVRNAVSVGRAASAMLASQDPKGRNRKTKPAFRKRMVPKSESLDPTKVEWSDVVTVAESYNPAVVPMPIRMGRVRENKIGHPAPFAVNNIELLKIPNFLHLTPPAIEKQCKALKALCTPWPENVGTRPLRYTTYNFIYPGPSIHHPDSRRVKLQVYLKDLGLDDHARRKMIILGGTRYNPANDELTLIEDRCPTRKQNKEYVTYLLTALYDEAWKTESWEEEIEEEIKQMSDAQLRRLTEGVLEKRPKEKRRLGNHSRIVGDRVIRYNRYGKAFVLEMPKYAIRGPPDKSLREEIEKQWRLIEGEHS